MAAAHGEHTMPRMPMAGMKEGDMMPKPKKKAKAKAKGKKAKKGK